MTEYEIIKTINTFVDNSPVLRKMRLNTSTRSYTGCMEMTDRNNNKTTMYLYINVVSDYIVMMLQFMDLKITIKSTCDINMFLKTIYLLINKINDYINGSYKEELIEIDNNPKVIKENTLNFKTLRKYINNMFNDTYI